MYQTDYRLQWHIRASGGRRLQAATAAFWNLLISLFREINRARNRDGRELHHIQTEPLCHISLIRASTAAPKSHLDV